MRKKLRKLKFNVLLYFLIFTAIIIACLWLFQVFFLESHYQKVKFAKIEGYGETLSKYDFGSDDFNKCVIECNDAGINVYKILIIGYPDGNKKFAYFEGNKEIDPDAEGAVIKQIFDKKSSDEKYVISQYNGLITYCSDGKTEGTYIVLTSSREKIDEAVSVIRFQFMIVSAIVIVIGVLLAWYFSIRLSKPIDEMSDTAKRWAKGDSSVSFTPKQTYNEISELADALNYAKDEISKTGALQRDLLANVSHDLKTPLTMIRAYAEMIRDISGENKQKREKHTQVIIDEADRLAMLVNDILNLSKLQSSVDSLDKKEVNLSELTERVFDRFSDYVENQGFTIEDHIAPDLITVVDEMKIEQVIYNLLGNSINYTGEDKTVKVYLTAENDYILLEIIDSGKGISKEKMETIWERYYRFSETNTRPVKGTGLGLSIVKAILDAHQLQFGVRSKKDCGSNFFVRFERVKNNEQ